MGEGGWVRQGQVGRKWARGGVADGLGWGREGSGQVKGFEHSAQNEDLNVPLNVDRTVKVRVRCRFRPKAERSQSMFCSSLARSRTPLFQDVKLSKARPS